MAAKISPEYLRVEINKQRLIQRTRRRGYSVLVIEPTVGHFHDFLLEELPGEARISTQNGSSVVVLPDMDSGAACEVAERLRKKLDYLRENPPEREGSWLWKKRAQAVPPEKVGIGVAEWGYGIITPEDHLGRASEAADESLRDSGAVAFYRREGIQFYRKG